MVSRKAEAKRNDKRSRGSGSNGVIERLIFPAREICNRSIRGWRIDVRDGPLRASAPPKCNCENNPGNKSRLVAMEEIFTKEKERKKEKEKEGGMPDVGVNKET